MVLGTENTNTADAWVRPQSSYGGSRGADGIRHTAGDATIGRMPVEHAEQHAAVVVDGRVSTVRENRKGEDVARQTTVVAVAGLQNLAQRFTLTIKSVEERLRSMS